MGLATRNVTVNTTPQLLSGAGRGSSGVQGVSDVGVLLYNIGANTCYIGGSDVSTATGIPLPINGAIDLGMLGAGDDVYGICVGGQSAEIRVLELA